MRKIIKNLVNKVTNRKLEKQLMNTLELPNPSPGQQNEDTENEIACLNATDMYRSHKGLKPIEKKYAKLGGQIVMAGDATLNSKDVEDGEVMTKVVEYDL